MTDREVMQMALDVVQRYSKETPLGNQPHMIAQVAYECIEALRTALAKPSWEPVAWGILNTRPTEKQPLMMVMLDEPEPSHLVVPLYTAPLQREWVGLTDEDYAVIERWVEFKEAGGDRIATRKLIKYIETALREKYD